MRDMTKEEIREVWNEGYEAGKRHAAKTQEGTVAETSLEPRTPDWVRVG